MSYYDATAKGYVRLHREEQFKKLAIIRDNLSVSKDDLMLDVGCGPGFSAEFFDCRIRGLDPSGELAAIAPFKVVIGVAEEIPFLDNYFDIVICITAIHNFGDFRKGILEMRRVGNNRFAFSLLKKSAGFSSIKSFVEQQFVVLKEVDEGTDLILFCSKK